MSVIVISGQQGSGKSTLTSAIEQAMRGVGACATLKFADPLYGIQKIVHDYLRIYCRLTPLKEGEVKDRLLLQWLGTEYGQTRFGQNVWADVWKERAASATVDLVLCDDMRFPHEFQAARDVGATIVRLSCPEEVRRERIGANFSGSTHPSETAMNGVPETAFDYVFDTAAMTPAEIVARLRAAGVIPNGETSGT